MYYAIKSLKLILKRATAIITYNNTKKIFKGQGYY